MVFLVDARVGEVHVFNIFIENDFEDLLNNVRNFGRFHRKSQDRGKACVMLICSRGFNG